jgi:hypothetical protein
LHTALLQHVDDASKRIVLMPPKMHIGRGVTGANDIALPTHDSRCSRLHATLVFDAGVWMLEDDSLNGTRINGQKLHHQLVVLNDGDYIQIGGTFHFVFKHLDMTDPGPNTQSRTTAEFSVPAVLHDESVPAGPGLRISTMGFAYRDGVRLPERLSNSEYRLLRRLIQTDCETVPFTEIAQAVWGAERTEEDVISLVKRVWAKVEPNPAQPRHVFVQPGSGVVIVCAGM